MKKRNNTGKLTPVKRGGGEPAKVTIRKLPTGVRGLDDIMGGGIPAAVGFQTGSYPQFTQECS